METLNLEFHSKYFFGILVVGIFLFSSVSVSGFSSRPTWLVSQNDLSAKHWPLDADYKFGNDSWYVDFRAPNGGFISIQPLQFSTPSGAINEVNQANATALAVQAAGSLHYAFPNFRFDFNATSSGFAWEVLSPCCYSRGVAFSIGNTYIHIFGSTLAQWQDVQYIFDKQVVKLDNYYNQPVPNSIVHQINQYQQNYTTTTTTTTPKLNLSLIAGFALLIVLPVIAIAFVFYSSIKGKFKKQ